MSYQHQQQSMYMTPGSSSTGSTVSSDKYERMQRETSYTSSRMAPHGFAPSVHARPSHASSSGAIIYQDMLPFQQQHPQHQSEDQSRNPSPHATRLYPLSVNSAGFSGSFELMQPPSASHQNSNNAMLYSSSSSSNHSHSHHHNHSHHNHHSQEGTSSSAAYGSSSQSAVHPVSSDLSWGAMSGYASSSASSTLSSHPHHQQTHHQQDMGTTALGGLPELREDFQGSMFTIEDDFNDAKILREVLQDQQQQHHHPADMMTSHHRYSSTTNNASHATSSLAHQPSGAFQFDSMGGYSTGPPAMMTSEGAKSIYMSMDTLAQIRSQSMSSNTSMPSFREPAAVSPSSSSYVSSSPSSPVASGSLKKKPASRICRVHGCTKGIRSRGLCKGHGGGRRCQTPGCEISDQGGGHCIAHGGGKRCNVTGCQKSAQSKGLCKLHGGARRCKIPNCTKNCQIKGLCRLHYSMYSNTSPSNNDPLM